MNVQLATRQHTSAPLVIGFTGPPNILTQKGDKTSNLSFNLLIQSLKIYRTELSIRIFIKYFDVGFRKMIFYSIILTFDGFERD